MTRIMAVAAVAATAVALALIAPQTASAAWTSPNSFKPGVAPEAIAVDSSTNTVYVAGGGTKGIHAVNGTTHKAVATYKVGHSIEDLATDPTNHYVLAAGHFGLAIVNEATKAIHTSTWAHDPDAVGVDPGNKIVILGGSDEEGNNFISFFNETDGTLRTTSAVEAVGIGEIAVDTATHVAYVAGYNSGEVSAFNDVTGVALGTASAAGGECDTDLGEGGCGPSGIAVNSTTGRLYVSNSEGPDDLRNSVSVLNATNLAVVADIPVFPTQTEDNNEPGYMAVDPTHNTVFSVGDGAAVVIDGATNTVIKDVSPGKHSYSVEDGTVAVNSTTGVAYVASGSFSSSGVVYTVANVPLPLKSATPKISGKATVGTVLTATPGTWTTGAALTYQWKAGGVAVTSDGTSSTHTVGLADAGKKLTVSVTGTLTGYATKTVTSKSTATVPTLPFTTTVAPAIAGNLTVGSTLTASDSGWSPTATFTYQWYRSGKKISGASSPTYPLVSSDRGKKITVKASGHSLGYTITSKTSLATAAIGYGTLSTATPSISPTSGIVIGTKLTASTGTWGPTKVTFSYTWLLNGKAIKGQHGSTFKVSKSDAGKVITVAVKGSKSGYTSQTLTSSGVDVPAA